MSARTATQRQFGQSEVPTSLWPAADLQRRVRNAITVVAAAVADFGEAGYSCSGRPALGFGPEKILAEAAMLAYAASRVPDAETHSAAMDLARSIATAVRTPEALADLALRPHRVFKRAVPHVLLTKMGLPDDEFNSRARPFADRVLSHALDEPGTVLAERDWVARLWALTTPASGGWSMLSRPLNLAIDSREEAYGVTHLLMYVTDFGARSGVACQRPVEEIAADVEALLVRSLDREDYDLCAELLMGWPELRMAWTPGAGFAFAVLAEAEDRHGVLPCGNLNAVVLDSLVGQERRRYARAMSYHTALVMGMLCATAATYSAPLARYRADPGGLPARPLGEVREWGGWRAAYDRLGEDQRRELAGLVSDIDISRALGDPPDARAVHAALQQARVAGLPPGPWQRAAEQWLDLVVAALAR